MKSTSPLKAACLATTLAASALLSLPAGAHVTLQTPQATIGANYKAVLRVGHGCDGADTTRLRVRIPDGVVNAKPQAKPGWDIQTTVDKYKEPVKLHGATVEQGVREISWSGKLPDAWYDEFVFVVRLTDTLKPGQPLYFPVVQECGEQAQRWIDTSGKHDVPNPAPALQLQAPEGGHKGHGHHH